MVSRLDVDGLGVELVRLYGNLEAEFARGVARRVAAGIDSPGWLQAKLAQSGEVRSWAEQLARRATIGASIRRTIAKAFDAGAESAQRSLAGPLRGRSNITPVQRTLPGAQAIDRLAAGLAGRLDSAGLRVARSVTDAYQRTVTAGAANTLGGALTRRQAGSQVWNRLLDQGFTGFTDVRGRNWSLAGYVDMATRTTTAQAAVAGQLDRQAQYGLDLVIVSNAPQECERCRPWEGKILSRTGPDGARTIEIEHATEDRMISVKIAGSVAEAIRAGLMHPNCRHSLSAYLPGLTKVPASPTADPDGQRARERLRALERQVRSAKLQEAGALTPEAKVAAIERQRVAQAKIRDHVKANKHLGIKRKPEREQLDLGNRREAGSPPPPAPAPPLPPAPAPPAVVRTPAQQVADSVRVDPSVPHGQVHEVRAALTRQAEMVPRAVELLGEVRSASAAELASAGPGTMAYYEFVGARMSLGPDPFSAATNAVGRRCSASHWWSRCPDELAGGQQVFAHEFGHHLDGALFRHYIRGTGTAIERRDRVKRFWNEAADALGIGRPIPVNADGSLGLVDIEDWFARIPVSLLETEISRYGATSYTEAIAEIWAEYTTMGANARSHIKRIGNLMKRMMEEMN